VTEFVFIDYTFCLKWDLNVVEPNISLMHFIFRIAYKKIFFTTPSEAYLVLDYSIHKAKERKKRLDLNGTQQSPECDVKLTVQETEYHE
jgi:hypothetical protein